MKIYVLAFAVLLFSSCENFSFGTKDKDKETTTDTTTTSTSTSPDTKQAVEEPKSAPDETVINAEPTLVRPQLFLMVKDFSDNPSAIKTKQNVLFNNLDFILVKNHLIPVGPPAAWHSQQPNLYVVEVGVPLAKKLATPEPGTFYRQTKRTKAVVVHFFGRRSLLPRAYAAMQEWLKENHQTAVGTPWEVYESDHKVVKDNDFLQTDVYSETM